MGLEYVLYPGEGAFYGPKLEFVLRDAIGRDWKCGTLQVDMNLPERFDITYVDEKGNRDKRPVMLHRALFGSLERFAGILIEHYSGDLPVWLSPVQVMLCNISTGQEKYIAGLSAMLNSRGFRTETDIRNEKIGLKIREHTIQRVPFMLVIGANEVENNSVSVRTRYGDNLGIMTKEEFVSFLDKHIRAKRWINNNDES